MMRHILWQFLFILLSSVSFGNYQTSFKTVSQESFPKVLDFLELQNLPRVRSQGAFGACAGYSAATVAQFYSCKHNKVNDCSKISRDKEISPIGMLAYANPNSDNSDPGNMASYENIKFSGSAAYALNNISRFRMAFAESCYPFDQVVNKYGDNEQAVEAMLGKLRTIFEQSKRTEGSACLECIQKTLKEDLLFQSNLKDIERALKKDTFEEFLYHSTIGIEDSKTSCDDFVDIRPEAKFDYFPQQGTASSGQIISKVKEVLKSGYPVVVGDLCPYSQEGKCLGTHSVAVTGYRKQCTKDGKQCRDLFRVQNSWGEEWQKENNDGWLDAQSLFDNRSIGTGTLAWLVPR